MIPIPLPSWTKRALLLAALTALLPACNLLELTRPSEVVRLRVLAIQAEPPEIGLGDTTVLTYEVGNPAGIDVENLWLLCTEADTGLGITTCGGTVLSLQDPTDDSYSFTASPETVIRQEEDGDGNLVDVTLEEALQEMEPLKRVEGLGFKVYLMVLPATDMAELLEDLLSLWGGGGDEEALAEAFTTLFDTVAEKGELATKRVVVSDKAAAVPARVEGCEAVDGLQPNANPALAAVGLVDGWTLETLGEIGEGGRLTAEPGETLTLRPTLAEGSVEAYYYISLEDEHTECRSEELLFGWYATAGEFSADYSYSDDLGVPSSLAWKAPEDETVSNDIDAWLVTWDRRGGMDWIAFQFSVEAP